MEIPSEKLDAFIEAAKSKGAPDETLAGLLRERGWAAKEISAAFGRYYEKLTGMAAPVRNARTGESALSAFFYLWVLSGPAMSAAALGFLLFDLYDSWFPDAFVTVGAGFRRWEISLLLALIIVWFPQALSFFRRLEQLRWKTDSGVRKRITYMALLIAAGILVGDLIAYLSHLLNGGLTVHFVLKALTLGAIASSIFSCYRSTLKESGERVQA